MISVNIVSPDLRFSLRSPLIQGPKFVGTEDVSKVPEVERALRPGTVSIF